MFALLLTRQLRLLRAPVQRASCTGAASFACARLAAGAAAQFARSPRHAELERRRIPGKEGTIWANGVYPLTIDFSEVCQFLQSVLRARRAVSLLSSVLLSMRRLLSCFDESVIYRTILTRFDNVHRASSLQSCAEWLHHRSLLAARRHACMFSGLPLSRLTP